MPRPAAIAALLLLAAGPADAQPGPAVVVRDPAGFRRAVAAAGPGTRVLLAPGTYRGNFYFQNVHGAAGRPVVIGAADPARPPRLVGAVTCLQISGASHLEVRDLLLTGASDNGLNIDDANRAGRPSHHVTVRNVRVADIGPGGNSDGMKLSGVDEFAVENCTVERWGRGNGSGLDMVGCHRGVVSGCTFRQGGTGNAVQAKGGSAGVVVRGCRFEDAGDRGVQIGGRTGFESFRPPLAGVPAGARAEAADVSVEGCVFTGGEAAVAFVGAAGGTVRFNTFYRPSTYAVRILQETTADGFVPCRGGVFEDNIVVFRSDKWGDGGVNVGPGTAPGTFRFARNVWYCEDRPDRSAPSLPAAETDGLVGVDPKLRDPARGDYGLAPGSPAEGRGAGALPATK